MSDFENMKWSLSSIIGTLYSNPMYGQNKKLPMYPLGPIWLSNIYSIWQRAPVLTVLDRVSPHPSLKKNILIRRHFLTEFKTGSGKDNVWSRWHAMSPSMVIIGLLVSHDVHHREALCEAGCSHRHIQTVRVLPWNKWKWLKGLMIITFAATSNTS